MNNWLLRVSEVSEGVALTLLIICLAICPLGQSFHAAFNFRDRAAILPPLNRLLLKKHSVDHLDSKHKCENLGLGCDNLDNGIISKIDIANLFE